jgi:hypothetical protein
MYKETQAPGADDECDALPQLLSNWKTVAEVAACLSVSEETVEKAIADGHLKADDDKRVFFSDVVFFLQEDEARRAASQSLLAGDKVESTAKYHIWD